MRIVGLQDCTNPVVGEKMAYWPLLRPTATESREISKTKVNYKVETLNLRPDLCFTSFGIVVVVLLEVAIDRSL